MNRTIDTLAAIVVTDGGAIVAFQDNSLDGPPIDEPFIVGIDKDLERTFKLGIAADDVQIGRAIRDYVGDLGFQTDVFIPGNYLGLWWDEGTLYCEVCRSYDDKDAALEVAAAAGQIAVYDSRDAEVYLV